MRIASVNNNLLLVAVALLILSMAGCSPARYNRAHEAPQASEIIHARPWLTEYFEHWQQEVDLTGEQWPGYSDLGVFPIGSGRVFAHEGTVYPLGTLTNVIGPTYQKGSFLGDIVPLVYLGKEVVAEGVENEADASYLRSIGCEFGQGFYYGEPMSARDVGALLNALANHRRRRERERAHT